VTRSVSRARYGDGVIIRSLSVHPTVISWADTRAATLDDERGRGVRFLANSRLAEGVGREQLIEYFDQHDVDSSTWDLFRHRVVADYMFKVGDEPGVVLFIDVETSGEAQAVVKSLPVVEQGLLRFEIEPVSAVARFSSTPG
jgi:hypothetical protein